MTERRFIFGEAADVYDRARPGYPAEAIAAVLTFAQPPQGGRLLEVGSGTGKATVPFAATGLRVLGLEPSPEMAALAVRNCAAYPNVQIEIVTFEDWTPEPSAFDIVLSAQAWHWVSRDVGFSKARKVLVPSGTLALLWNEADRSEDEMRRALDDVYRRLAPDLFASHREEPARERDIRSSGVFDQPTVLTFPWTMRYSTARYVELMTTYSDHRLLPEAERDRLLEAVAEVIEGAGGEISVDSRTWVYLARGVMW